MGLIESILNEVQGASGTELSLKATVLGGGTAVALWLRYCGTNRKVAGSIPDGVIGIFH
jgi:hypothetical protein